MDKSFCPHCGGQRNHEVLGTYEASWNDDPVYGHDKWSILKCAGCDEVTFVHRHWFSEDLEAGDDGLSPKIYVDIYPPAPDRKQPEWGRRLFLYLKTDETWLKYLYDEIYKALGLGLFSTASMAVRAIVDHIVTSRAEDDSKSFPVKLKSLVGQGLISDQKSAVLEAAFDFGSATAHRGYRPSEEDLKSLLDIAESLIEAIYVAPSRLADEARAAALLKQRTPPRPPRRKPDHAKCTP